MAGWSCIIQPQSDLVGLSSAPIGPGGSKMCANELNWGLTCHPSYQNGTAPMIRLHRWGFNHLPCLSEWNLPRESEKN